MEADLSAEEGAPAWRDCRATVRCGRRSEISRGRAHILCPCAIQPSHWPALLHDVSSKALRPSGQALDIGRDQPHTGTIRKRLALVLGSQIVLAGQALGVTSLNPYQSL